MYRFGWRKADKIEYYSDFLGVSDEITDSDMIIGEDKTKLVVLERELRETNERLSKYMEHRDFALEEVEKMKEDMKVIKKLNELVTGWTNNPEVIKKIVEVHNRKLSH